ncbi:hypothetical protein V2J09_004596 [Rumex salicifolius]
MAEYLQNYFPWLLLLIIFTASTSVTGLQSVKPGVSNPFWSGRHNNGRRVLLNTKQHLYNQTMDHFNYRPESYQTFRQKYVIVDDHWGGAKNSSPIFIYLGAEEPIDSDLTNVGLLNEIAPHFNALIVFIEHRYYGMSNPKGSMRKSLDDPESLGYFSSGQALADYAEIILFLKNHYKAQHSPVFVFGGSYGGMLATWFRLKYPHVAMGALASSAPIFMTTKPSDTYDNWVNKVYMDTSKSCHETIARSWGQMAKLGSTPNGLKNLSKIFNTCSMICKAVDGASKGATDLDKVTAAASLFITNNSCLPVASSAATKPDTSSDQTTLGWSWQTCSELVNPMGRTFNSSVTNTVTPLNPFDLQSFIQDCNATFGDLRLVLKRTGSNIIFSNGLRDPFSQEGVLKSISETLVALKAVNGSHTLDLLYAKESDPKWLKAMRKKEVKIMEEWLSLYYSDLRAYLNGH